MTDLATVGQLAVYLNRDIAVDDPAALQALTVASSAVRAYCGHPISETLGDTATLDGSGTTVLLLPGVPVTSVDQVSVNGEALALDAYRWSTQGFLLRTDGYLFPSTPRSVEVTYSHGWASVPGAILGVVLALAGRILDGSAGIKQEAIGSYSVTYQNPTVTLQAGETLSLDPFKVAT